MTRVHGKLFRDGRSGLLVVKPSQPFFGVSRDPRNVTITDGSIDLELDPTPAGVFYLVGYKEVGDIRKTDFTLKWRVPDQDEYDITPGATQKQGKDAVNTGNKASVFERVQLRRTASELGAALDEQSKLAVNLEKAEQRILLLEQRLRDWQVASEEALIQRDQTIAKLSAEKAPEVRTVYVDRPVPPEPLKERIQRLEAENQRLTELNKEYHKSVVKLHQLQLDKAPNLPPSAPSVESNSPKQRLRRKLVGN